MKLLMTLLVRDEADILRENLEFHLAHGVDEFIVMDNLSLDGTTAIAEEYERAGVLRLVPQPADDYAQGRWVTEMARRAASDLGADWVINCDADEFWCPATGSLKDTLAAINPGAPAISAERTNFVPRPDTGEPFWRRMDVRRAVSTNLLGQPLPAKVAHRGRQDILVAQGNHSVEAAGACLPAVHAPVTILHFPLRTPEQFANKIARGGAAYARNTELDPGIGSTWRELHERYCRGELDAVYDAERLSEAEIARGLASGDLVHDRRLVEALDRLGIDAQPEVFR